QCLLSIAGQTYASLEVIVVDDGSTDGSGRIAEEFAKHDSRFRVIHQPNGGLSAARNTALEVITGQCVTFVDSDDFIAPQFVESLLRIRRESGAQAVLCGWHDYAEGDIPVADGPQPFTSYTPDEATSHILYQRRGLTHSAWGRLYDAAVFGDVRFPEGMLYEDLGVLMPVMQRVSAVAFTPQRLYYYRQRPGSILATFNPRRAHVLDILEDLERQAPTAFPQHLKAIQSRLLSAYCNMLRLAPDGDQSVAPIIKRSWLGIKRLRRSCLFDGNVRPRNKAAILLSLLGRKALTKAIRR
ncbi:MAG: glycosyltransferase, partial [Bacteroidales bacterium]|nr:glycosyltransferase [Bacteroidales bacterium]